MNTQCRQRSDELNVGPRRARTGGLLVAAAVALLLAVPAWAGTNPWQLADEINAVVTTGHPLDALNWRGELDSWDATNNRWRFNCWQVNCSQNLPVLSAVVAVMYEPMQGGHDMRQWFLIFLKAQLGQAVTEQSVPVNLTYFKGSEMFSPVYDGWTTLAVMSAYYWSVKMQPTAPYAADIKLLADDYLRASFYLWGLSVGKSYVSAQYKNDATTPFAGAATNELHPVGTASPRAVLEVTNSRTWLFANAVGYATSAWRALSMATLTNTLVSRWPDVFGLNATQRQYLKDLVELNALPGNFNAVMVGIKMVRKMHFMIWNGDRLTFLEGTTPNGNNGIIFAQAYYFSAYSPNSSGREIHYLWPYNGTSGSNKSGSLTINSAASRLDATGDFAASLAVRTDKPLLQHVRLGPTGLTYCLNLACN